MDVERSYLGRLTTDEFESLIAGDRPVVVILPVGCVEPHGPHLALATDTVISEAAAERAVPLLSDRGLVGLIAPPVPYGVTRCASSFRGAISVSPASLRSFITDVVEGFLSDGVAHVCLVNNHLEPEHDAAVRASTEAIDAKRVSVACPLTRKWARTLSEEFKSGACHAGRYETSLILASHRDDVREDMMKSLPEVPVSLSDHLQSGVTDFKEMGLTRAYSGAPADASQKHGEEQLEKLATMIATEIVDALHGDAGTSQ